MTNPYTTPIPPTPPRPDARPLHKRVLVWIGGSALFIAGTVIGSAGNDGQQPVQTGAKPSTTVTATPEPGPTVTETVKAKTRPGPTVTVTKSAATAADSGTENSRSENSSGEDSAGRCTIVSNSGNCYSAGQFCRNSDHGVTTTNTSGRKIKCTYRSNAWRWSYI